MKKKSNTPSRNRMIHIRLNEETHKRLKIKAVQNNATIQKLVEDLILQSLVTSKGGTI
jgi:predicted HicB family RNase H-like nuclease